MNKDFPEQIILQVYQSLASSLQTSPQFVESPVYPPIIVPTFPSDQYPSILNCSPLDTFNPFYPLISSIGRPPIYVQQSSSTMIMPQAGTVQYGQTVIHSPQVEPVQAFPPQFGQQVCQVCQKQKIKLWIKILMIIFSIFAIIISSFFLFICLGALFSIPNMHWLNLILLLMFCMSIISTMIAMCAVAKKKKPQCAKRSRSWNLVMFIVLLTYIFLFYIFGINYSFLKLFKILLNFRYN